MKPDNEDDFDFFMGQVVTLFALIGVVFGVALLGLALGGFFHYLTGTT